MRLKEKIRSILSRNTQSSWAYKLSVRDVSIFFDTGKFKHGKKSAEQFLNEYNNLFNKSEINAAFNKDIDRLRLSNKIDELRAIYYSLIYSDGENAKVRFKELFGKDFEGTESDIKKINDKAQFFIDKLKNIPQSKNDGITFSELVAIVENSRSINIDREMKLFEFHKIYELELKKWKNG